MPPVPKPEGQRRRRNAPLANTRHLPASGREGEPPEWPLRKKYPEEAAIWAELWTTPQAVAWEKLGYLRTVARYCRLLVEVEEPKAPAMQLSEARQLEDRLGLTPMSMLRLRWEIDEVHPSSVTPINEAPKQRRRLNLSEDES